MKSILFIMFISVLYLPVYAMELSKKELLGQFNPSKNRDFVRIAARYTTKPRIYMRKKAYNAFVKMHKAARKDGVRLIIVSATRTFYQQKAIWEAKWTGRRRVEGLNLAKNISDPVKRAGMILLYSSMPGTSRHHWGTDIDLNSLSDSYFLHGKGKHIYQWLTAHASKYGFYQVYTHRPPRTAGYQEEKWHWSYRPLSYVFLRQYLEKISIGDIRGFKGDKTAKAMHMIRDYVLGINPVLIPPDDK